MKNKLVFPFSTSQLVLLLFILFVDILFILFKHYIRKVLPL